MEIFDNIIDPYTNAPVSDSNIIETVNTGESGTTVVLNIAPETADARAPLVLNMKEMLEKRTGKKANVLMTSHKPDQTPKSQPVHDQPADIPPRAKASFNKNPIAHVRHVIAVASGKGGVGKSTTTVNLAHALTKTGLKVGILDADIYGPSIPRMMGLYQAPQPEITDDGIIPHENYGVKTMSMGYITGDEAAILRAPMITKALHQMLRGAVWGTKEEPLDILLVDMPPGTGDITLSLAQACPLSGVVIVTTPQDVAVIDAKKCLEAFHKLQVPILGVIENMSGLTQPDGTINYVFGKDGGKHLAEKTANPFLGEVVLEPAIASAVDKGDVYEAADGAHAQYQTIAEKLLKALDVNN